MTAPEYIALLFDECGFDTAAQREAMMTRKFGKPVKYADQLDWRERSKLIDILKTLKAQRWDRARGRRYE